MRTCVFLHLASQQLHTHMHKYTYCRRLGTLIELSTYIQHLSRKSQHLHLDGSIQRVYRKEALLQSEMIDSK